MAVGNTFDLWQKDVFFSAAEEVQESTDVMDSVYRLWLRERKEGHKHDVVDELRRELQTALGTAKWQLEEFERAVQQSHGNLPLDKNTITRHGQFIAAIEEHISNVERALGDSLVKEGKEPLRWVQLDEGERDDLALFLSPALPSSQRTTDPHTGGDDCAQDKGLPNSIENFKEVVTFNNDVKYVIELETKDLDKTKDEMCIQAKQNNGQRRTWSSPDIAAWKIVIADGEDEERKPLETRTESPVRAHNFFNFMKDAKLMAKAKWLRSSFGKVKNEDHLPVRQEISSNLDLKGVTRVSQKLNVLSERGRSCLSDCKEVGKNSCFVESQHQVSGYQMQLKRSLRFTLLLVLSMLLVGELFSINFKLKSFLV